MHREARIFVHEHSFGVKSEISRYNRVKFRGIEIANF
jgi:hypothetical protein